MKTKTYRISLLMVAFIVIFIATAVVLRYQNEENQKISRQSGAPMVVYQYFLQEYDGKIGIYHTGDDTPFRVLNVYISTLPSLDQLTLQDGFYVENDEKLQQTLEDFES